MSYYTRQPADRFVAGGLPPPNLFQEEIYTGVTGKQIIFRGLKTYFNTKADKQGTQAQRQKVQRTAEFL